MKKERMAKAVKTVEIGAQTYFTVCGLREQLPGRSSGTHISVEQIFKLIKEGMPCFSFSGRYLFDLSKVQDWLVLRQPTSQLNHLVRFTKIRG